MQSTWCSLLQSIELMPPVPVFRLAAASRDLKQSYSKRTERKAIAIIRRSCSDSLSDRETNGLNFRKRGYLCSKCSQRPKSWRLLNTSGRRHARRILKYNARPCAERNRRKRETASQCCDRLLRDLGIDKKMPKEELIQFESLVIEILPDARYRVQLDAGYEVLAYTVALLR